MDADTNDSVPGMGDGLNGDAKHDSSTLIQAAIINKDVMLSGVNNQSSPLSSALSPPSISVPVTMSSLSSSGVAALGDNFFLGIQPLGMTDLADLHKHDPMSDVHSMTLSSAHQQLLGQPQVAPQFLIANQTGLASPSTMPVQHLLIPVSTGNGTQQLVSIPLSLAAGLGNQMQLLATSSGQLIATNMAGLAPQLNLTIPTSSNAMQPLLMVASPLSLITNVTQNIQNLALRQLVQQQQQQKQQLSGSPANSVVSPVNIPQIITNAQGQILAIGSPQLLQQNLVTNSTAGPTKIGQLVQQLQRSADGASGVSSTGAAGQLALALSSSIPVTSAATSQQKTLQLSISQMTQALLTAGAISQATQTGCDAAVVAIPTTGAATGASSSTNANGVTPNINQLLPNTISSTREGTIVDGVNLDEMREFAKQFKIRRLSLGLTQTQVGQALSVTEGPSYSQSAICRFEKLDITPKSAQKIKPVLERWMEMAEERYKNGMQNLSEFIGLEPSKKRKRRTSFTPQALELLNEHFEQSTHPSGSEMTELAEKLNFDREVIRVWFCNKRQTLKNTIKKLKSPQSPNS